MKKSWLSKYYKDFCVLFILGILLMFSYLLTHGKEINSDSKVVIMVNGEEYGRYELAVDNEIPVQTEYGSNTILISDYQVMVKEASCRDKICMKFGILTDANQSIICIPNRLIVFIENEKEYDTIAY